MARHSASGLNESWEGLPAAAQEDDARPTSSASSSTREEGAFGGFLPKIRTRLFGRASSGQDDNENSSFFRPGLLRNYGSMASMVTEDSRYGYGGPRPEHQNGTMSPHSMLGDAVTDGLLGGPGPHRSTTQWLAETHGVQNTRTMYVETNLAPLKTPAKGHIPTLFCLNAHALQVPHVLSPCDQVDPTVSVEVCPR